MLEEIRIVALGPTWSRVPPPEPNTETWGCNSIYRDVKLDRLFVMHDIRKDIFLRDVNFFEEMNKQDIPVYMTSPEPGLKQGIVYPVKEVYNEFKVIFFMDTIAWMMAYAIMLKPKKISLYGVDMRPDSGIEHHKNEKGCVEFWCGVATGRGIKLYIPPESFIMKSIIGGIFYGFKTGTRSEGCLGKFVPEKTLACHRSYKVIPIDKEGNEMREEESIIELRGLLERTKELERITIKDAEKTL